MIARTRSRFAAWAPTFLVAAMAMGAAACLGDTASTECGSGSAFAWGGTGYCIYAAPIIIEGFDCPAARPFEFPLPDDGVVVCGPAETSPDGGWDAMMEAWRESREPDPGDVVGGDGSSPDSAPSDVVSSGRSPCDRLLEQPLGSAIDAVAGGGCTIAARCSAGVVATCALGPYAVDCAYGDLRVVPLASAACPVHRAGLDVDCLPELGADACAEGLFCPSELRRCVALPALCDASACRDDRDCAGACVDNFVAEGIGGLCLAAPALGACWEPDGVPVAAGATRPGDRAQCPVGWSCAGVQRVCAPCSPCAGGDLPGRCQAMAYQAIGLVDAGGYRADVLWWVGTADTLIDCPGFRLELRNELTGAWEAGPSDATCAGPVAAAPAELRSMGEVAVTPTPGFAYAWVRARGNLYAGCTGATPETCSSGATEFVSEPLLLVP